MKSPGRSLPTRIVFFVFAATLITSLTVTAVSVGSIDSFLRGNIEERFPAVLQTTHEQLESWYDQREREMSVFSQSDVLRGNLSILGKRTSNRRHERASAEIEQYIRYVLSEFPQYASLIVLGADGENLLSVGRPFELSDKQRAELVGLDTNRIGRVLWRAGEAYQIASAPLLDPDARHLGGLHAVLRVESLGSNLPTQELGVGGRVLVVAEDGRCVVSSDSHAIGDQHTGPLAANGSEPTVQDYTTNSGEQVVGGARPFPRFGFTLIVQQPYNEAFAPVVGTIWQVLVINLAIVLVMGIAAFRIAVSIVRPIEALSDAAKRISDGERNVEIPDTKSGDEVGLLTRAFSDMTMRLTSNAAELALSHTAVEEANEQLRLQNEELQCVNEVLEQLSITDGLTKLHNHRYFQETLVQECKRASRSNKPLSLILIDIDYFKTWNDRLGHAGGDEILRSLAGVMCELIRETDLLARYGGEEFAVITPSTDLDGATALAEKLRATVAETSFVLDVPSEQDTVTVSIGVASFTGDRQKLFNDADRALYRAKESGRDCVIRSEPDEQL